MLILAGNLFIGLCVLIAGSDISQTIKNGKNNY